MAVLKDDVEDVLRIAAESEKIGRENERAAVVAYLRGLARAAIEEDDAVTMDVLADFIEEGKHHG